MNLTQQQKLEIMCAYLPNGVEIEGNEGTIIEFTKINHSVPLLTCNSDIRPILRHPDDMTEEELMHLANNWGLEFGKSILLSETPMYLCHAIEAIRYLHSLHIDTFGAIEAGFAIRKETN